ncbi:MAG: cytochrome c [Acidobacteriota bacterium]|nr:cytochrome c [Acidobacteriota bacterium]
MLTSLSPPVASYAAAAAALWLLSACAAESETGSPVAAAEEDAATPVPSETALSLPRPEPHPGMPGLLNDAELEALRQAREGGLRDIAGLPDFGFGETASPERIAAWDIDIGPDGEGLPPGSGSVERGETLYRLQCVQCHGARGEGSQFEALAGRVPGDRFPFSEDRRYPITVGSYWPYATTLFDYIRRAMPQAAPGSLPPDDVYALTAFILQLNGLLGSGDSLDAESLPRIRMPARDRFVRDDRRGGPEVR